MAKYIVESTMSAEEISDLLHRGMDDCGCLDEEFSIKADEPRTLATIDPPCQFLFGIDDGGFGEDGLYVWIVGEPYYLEQGYVDDSSSASSVISRENQDQDDPDRDTLIDNAHAWLSQATNGILGGECMESCWETGYMTDDDREQYKRLKMNVPDPYAGKTRDEAIELIKAALIERGFKHEPKLEQDGV